MSFRCLRLAVLYCICTLCTISNIFAQSPGETSPRIIIEIGDNANITCRMNLKMFDGENSSSLYFTSDEPKHEAALTNIRIINATTIVYMLRNASEQFTIYTCKSGQYAISSTDVIVGTKPTEVKDFNCQAFDFTYMTCSFTIPQNMVPTTYNLKYITQNAARTADNRTIYSQNYILNCVKLVKEGDKATCNFTLEDGSYKPNFEFYNFRLTSNNTLGALTQNFTINHKEIVKPAISNFRIEDISSNACVLKWEMERYSSYKLNRLQMEVHLQSPHYQSTRNFTCKKCNNREMFDLSIDDLPYAYYEYNISLRIKMRMPAATWSDAYSIVFRTLPLAPEVPPQVDVSSFYLNATHLRLFWYPTAEYHRNGTNFHYIVKLTQKDGVPVNQAALHKAVPTVAFPWNSAHSYDFNIWSSNEMGVSLRSSRIYVPALPKNYDERTPFGIRNVYHSLDRTYTLLWNAPEDAEGLESYTVFWCQPKSVASNECHNIIGFTQLDKKALNFTIEHSETLILAVAANYRDYYTGMHWAKCTADVLNDLEKLEPEVEANAYSINVRWNSEHTCASLIKGYTINYCQTKPAKKPKCWGKSERINVDKRDNKYEIKNLKPNSTYQIEMYIYSDLKEGPKSNKRVIQTQEGAPTPPRNLNFENITSQSVALSWQSPQEANGKIRYYIVTYNRENQTVHCKHLSGPYCFVASRRGERYGIENLTYTLQNLSSFTNYTICIKAFTVAESLPSNCVVVKTHVGVPTSPINPHFVETNKVVWEEPEVPSGRVDYYEVIFEAKLRQVVEGRYISRINNGRLCTLPRRKNCDNEDYGYTISIRSVNIAYANETDTKLAQHAKQYTEYDPYVSSDNYELRCVEAAPISPATPSSKYIEYRSDAVRFYENRCSPPAKADSKLWIIIFCIIIGASFIFMCGLLIYRRCHAMAAISCKIPQNLEDLVNGSADKLREHEKFMSSSVKQNHYNSENGSLLTTSISNDSNYSYNGTRYSATTKSSYCDSRNTSDYGNSHATDDYCIQDPLTLSNTALLTPVPETGYMTMTTPINPAPTQLKPANVGSMLDNGYVLPNALPTEASEKPFMIALAAGDGYVHPNNRQSFNNANISSANYITAMR
ncbi:cytokine receptor isoform X1 [Bactrocera dorsalis]|uniref:Cytokine receptor isoform X1 n=1 Tax=Bactrocera dorsalis TaxID=27457 RepID=A0A6I9VD00_BACDO|nr:cytokine receptor isoform X1 [Bactrocera dorsalis]